MLQIGSESREGRREIMNQSARRNIIAPAEGALHLMDTSFSSLQSTCKPLEDVYPLNFRKESIAPSFTLVEPVHILVLTGFQLTHSDAENSVVSACRLCYDLFVVRILTRCWKLAIRGFKSHRPHQVLTHTKSN